MERATGCSHAQIRACQTSNRGCRPSFGHWHQHQCHAGMVATLIFCCQQAEQTYALVHQKRFFHCHAGGRLFWAALQKQHLVLVDSAALGTWTPKPPSPISAEVERRSSCGDRLGPPRRGASVDRPRPGPAYGWIPRTCRLARCPRKARLLLATLPARNVFECRKASVHDRDRLWGCQLSPDANRPADLSYIDESGCGAS